FVTAKQISELQQTDTSPNIQTVSKGNSPFMLSQEEELNSPILEFQGFQWNFPKDTQNFTEFQDILQKETKRIKEAATNQLMQLKDLYKRRYTSQLNDKDEIINKLQQRINIYKDEISN